GLIEHLHSTILGEPRHVAGLVQVRLHDHILQENYEVKLVLPPDALKRSERRRGQLEEVLAPADSAVRLPEAIERNRDAPRVGQGQLLDLGLAGPIAMSQELHEEPDRHSMRDQVDRERLQHGLAAGQGGLDRPEPASHLREHTLPLLEGGRILLASVLPDVAVHAARVAPLREQDPHKGRPAVIGQATARESPQAVVDPFVGTLVGRRGYPRHLSSSGDLRPHARESSSCRCRCESWLLCSLELLVDEYRQPHEAWRARVFDQAEPKTTVGATQSAPCLIDSISKEAGEPKAQNRVKPSVDDGPEA